MNKYQALFLIVCTLLAVVLVIFSIETVPQVTGYIHPDFPSMLKGGSSAEQPALFRYLVLFVGVLILIILCISLFIGLDNKKRALDPTIKFWVGLGTSLYVIIFVLLVLVNWNYLDNEGNVFIGGFPLPTAIMLYGLTLFPLFFSIIYIFRFDDSILTGADLAEFEKIVRSREQRKIK